MGRELKQKLARMTVANGCTPAEAQSASKKLDGMRDAELAKIRAEEAQRKAIEEKAKERSRVESQIALSQAREWLKDTWDELGYDLGNIDYREFKNKHWIK